ncbi:MAG: type II toxin-antitoxin system YafQ family toxin [Clostridia bacterium]|nr:type II toxin-antitoxin system YafQ family toxin [Clostridia bacterium]MBQ3155182.1 type II toxin-antitoxin system YafQ family toxin [Clostridia bacterium]
MKYEIVPSNQFKKDLKLAKKRGYDLDKIKNVIAVLANGEDLDAKYRDHLLTGDYGGFRECHIQPDWLLVYQINGEKLLLFLARTGTHSDLF